MCCATGGHQADLATILSIAGLPAERTAPLELCNGASSKRDRRSRRVQTILWLALGWHTVALAERGLKLARLSIVDLGIGRCHPDLRMRAGDSARMANH